MRSSVLENDKKQLARFYDLGEKRQQFSDAMIKRSFRTRHLHAVFTLHNRFFFGLSACAWSHIGRARQDAMTMKAGND